MTALSETRNQRGPDDFSVPPSAAKLLVVLDEAALSEGFSSFQSFFSSALHLHFIVQTKQKKKQILFSHPELAPCSLDCLMTISSERLLSILRIQFMGTRLAAAGNAHFIKTIRNQAETAGFSDEEMHLRIIGFQKEAVFCVTCYTRHDQNQKDIFVCPSCRTELAVSRHYSRRLDAYLGYVHS